MTNFNLFSGGTNYYETEGVGRTLKTRSEVQLDIVRFWEDYNEEYRPSPNEGNSFTISQD